MLRGSSGALAMLSAHVRAACAMRSVALAQPLCQRSLHHRAALHADAADSATPAADPAAAAKKASRRLNRARQTQRRRDAAAVVASVVAEGGPAQAVMVEPTRAVAKSSKANLANTPPITPAVSAGAAAAVPKQKVAMYSKLLRVVRSPVRGALANTQGDDYLLGADEGQSTHAHFTGLITANLTGPAKARGGKKAGKDTGRSYGKGGRKSARAHVWIQKAIVKGTGDFYVNGLRYVEYFSQLDHRWEVCAPFFHTNTLTDFDMIAVVNGGGRSGQAGAIKHAAAKALQAYDRARYRGMLKKKFLLSRDARVVERKKYGQKKARKQFTFVKR